MITIVIADDQSAVREGLRMRLALEADMQVVGEAGDGLEALEVVPRLQPKIVIMDLEMPGMNGPATTKALQPLAPQSRVIILTIHDDETARRQARESGAAGFVSKHADEEVLLKLIRTLANDSKRKC
jgi:DNA-binding NarL/FixJ family response regulator